MKIFLLTHERELERKTNTGALALNDSNEIIERIVWERKIPNKKITNLIENEKALLLYSKGEATSTEIDDYENIIIIDGTWQEAQKIFNKSPYLKDGPRHKLETSSSSMYKLRRNQTEGGLCTIECIIEVLKLKGQEKLASEMELKFEHFNN